ncbi:TPA: hypothetical protein MIO26_28295, partial [Klebsiella pneumoniae subsp. pneumoniae]|nr:hypothetical protein [Klebsiella pneumoniae subsp. pneumoniae]
RHTLQNDSATEAFKLYVAEIGKRVHAIKNIEVNFRHSIRRERYANWHFISDTRKCLHIGETTNNDCVYLIAGYENIAVMDAMIVDKLLTSHAVIIKVFLFLDTQNALFLLIYIV